MGRKSHDIEGLKELIQKRNDLKQQLKEVNEQYMKIYHIQYNKDYYEIKHCDACDKDIKGSSWKNHQFSKKHIDNTNKAQEINN